MQKGENVGKIVYKVESKERVNTVVATKFTIGAKIDEKWSTILSQEVNERNREGEREFRFHAE